MTTFDGSTVATSERLDPINGLPAGPPEPIEAFDPLESLREQLAERDEEEERTTPVLVPGIGWRLQCAIDFDYPTYKEWQKAALPRKQRNGRRVNMLDLDQAALAVTVLVSTCEAIQYRDAAGNWHTMTDPDDSATTLESSALLSRFQVMDPRLFARKLFGRDAPLVAAGMEVIQAAGWDEPDGGAAEGDPTA